MSEKIPVRNISKDAVQSFHPEFTAKRQKIHTKLIRGFYQNIRTISMYSLMVLFVLLPFLRWDGRQALLFDIPHRQFYIFSQTFMPQDLFLLSWLFIMAAFVLFVATVFGGRVFCGYSCPQTIWVNLFMHVEKWFEGERHQRIRLDKAPMTVNKLLRRTGKHLVWLAIALLTGLTFVSYFSSVEDLYGSWQWLSVAGLSIPLPDWNIYQVVFISIFTVATYMNAGWMREQMCFHICPYGRFQSVMFDRDTLIVSYDAERGEPRGARKRNSSKTEELGDCIDCNLCVHVCPTGIDIRDGLQMECIQCAACVDACDSVMDRMGYARGLVRYTTERELVEKEKTHWLRPRLIGYSAVLAIMFALFAWTLVARVPLQIEAIRDRNQLYRVSPDGQTVENVYLLKITNKTQNEQEYRISMSAPNGLRLDMRRPEILLDAGEVYEVPLTVVGDMNRVRRAEVPITFKVNGITDPSLSASVENRFRAPSASERAKALRAEQREME
jgi:cytochrome c oxidase accessory protein FixG